MRILAVDVGTGTQDILLFESEQPVENALQLIMPSPTKIAEGRIRRATEARRPVLVTGVNSGGEPCSLCGAVSAMIRTFDWVAVTAKKNWISVKRDMAPAANRCGRTQG